MIDSYQWLTNSNWECNNPSCFNASIYSFLLSCWDLLDPLTYGQPCGQLGRLLTSMGASAGISEERYLSGLGMTLGLKLLSPISEGNQLSGTRSATSDISNHPRCGGQRVMSLPVSTFAFYLDLNQPFNPRENLTEAKYGVCDVLAHLPRPHRPLV